MDIEYLKRQAADAAARAIELRRELHKWPEPGNEEFRTVDIIKRALEDTGLQVRHLLPTGMVCTISGDKISEENQNEKAEGMKNIALRADIDGLPIQEKPKLPFSSKISGYMHACGHDVHTAVLLGTAMVLSNNKHLLNRCVKLLFQPAEETMGGAERMIAAGCLRNPEIHSVYGLHIKPELMAGQVGIKYGCVHAASDMFHIYIKGLGSHGASPEEGVDALLTGCNIVNHLQTAISRSIKATDPAVLTVGSFHSGTAGNVIAGEAILEGTVRSLEKNVSDAIRQRMEDIVKHTALAAGAEGRIEFTKGYPELVNDDTANNRIVKLAEDLIGKENLIRINSTSMRVEDFSYYLHNTEGAFFFLGSGFPYRENPPIHSDNLYINEKCIETGILMMSALCLYE